MGADKTELDMAAEADERLAREWWAPFADYLVLERRYSAYTLRNYRQAFEDFIRWRRGAPGAGSEGRELSGLTPRVMRDFVIEAQSRFGRRTQARSSWSGRRRWTDGLAF